METRIKQNQKRIHKRYLSTPVLIKQMVKTVKQSRPLSEILKSKRRKLKKKLQKEPSEESTTQDPDSLIPASKYLNPMDHHIGTFSLIIDNLQKLHDQTKDKYKNSIQKMKEKIHIKQLKQLNNRIKNIQKEQEHKKELELLNRHQTNLQSDPLFTQYLNDEKDVIHKKRQKKIETIFNHLIKNSSLDLDLKNILLKYESNKLHNFEGVEDNKFSQKKMEIQMKKISQKFLNSKLFLTYMKKKGEDLNEKIEKAKAQRELNRLSSIMQGTKSMFKLAEAAKNMSFGDISNYLSSDKNARQFFSKKGPTNEMIKKLEEISKSGGANPFLNKSSKKITRLKDIPNHERKLDDYFLDLTALENCKKNMITRPLINRVTSLTDPIKIRKRPKPDTEAGRNLKISKGLRKVGIYSKYQPADNYFAFHDLFCNKLSRIGINTPEQLSQYLQENFESENATNFHGIMFEGKKKKKILGNTEPPRSMNLTAMKRFKRHRRNLSGYEILGKKDPLGRVKKIESKGAILARRRNSFMNEKGMRRRDSFEEVKQVFRSSVNEIICQSTKITKKIRFDKKEAVKNFLGMRDSYDKFKKTLREETDLEDATLAQQLIDDLRSELLKNEFEI